MGEDKLKIYYLSKKTYLLTIMYLLTCIYVCQRINVYLLQFNFNYKDTNQKLYCNLTVLLNRKSIEYYTNFQKLSEPSKR